MIKHLTAMGATLLLCSVPVLGQDQIDPPKITAPTDEQVAANATAKALGERIFLHDQAALHASDRLSSDVEASDLSQMRGYVTEEAGQDQFEVTFYSIIGDEYLQFAHYVVAGSKVLDGGPIGQAPAPALSESQTLLAKAREAALQQGASSGLQLCMANSANFVTLPADEQGLVSVYILSAPSVKGRYPLGGHYLYKVNAESAVVSGRRFASRCFDVPVIATDAPNRPDSYQMAYLMDNHPTEIHHFVARQMNLPLALSAGNVLWNLDYRVKRLD